MMIVAVPPRADNNDMPSIKYREGFKYQLAETYCLSIPITPFRPISEEYIQLDADGGLTIREGYAWDGPSGPTIDTLNFMRGSLVHDALYQLLRDQKFSPWKHDEYRIIADQLLYDICREDGMSALRAWWVHWAVRNFGGPSASPQNSKKIIAAPR